MQVDNKIQETTKRAEKTPAAEIAVVKQAMADPLSSMRSLVKSRLYYFLQYFWSEYSQDTFKPNWHIKYICEELEAVAKRVARNEKKEYDLIINVPPGSTKTAIVSIMFPLWCWVNWFWMRFITASYTAALSLESAQYSRDIMRSDRFRELFPEIDIKQDKDTKSNFRVVKYSWVHKGYASPRHIQGGNRFSTSVGGTLTGFHGHINIIDDPIDPTRVMSEKEVETANHWMDNVLPFRKVDKLVTPTILIMQRLHQNDPTGHLLGLRGEEIKHICIPGEIRSGAGKARSKVKPAELVDNYVDDLMDPDRLNWEVLHSILKLGQYTYGGQVIQDPVPLGGGMFKVDMLNIIDQAPPSTEIIQTVRYWDKAGTEGGDGAYTVGAKLCKMKDGKFAVLDIKRGRWGTDERERIIRATAESDGQNVRQYVEQEPGSGGKDSAKATMRNLAGYPAERDRPTGDKALRADPYSVQVNEGNVYLVRGEWNKDYKDELEFFPNSTYKDQVDASSGAFGKLSMKQTVRVLRRG